jgi:RNA recognition motif-containing protein
MNIYVGNLPRTITEETLKKLFEQFGQVTAVKIIKDKFTGQVKGFGFVDMPNASEAAAAIAGANGYDLDGMKLRVNEAREPEARPRMGGNGGGGYNRGGGSTGGGWQRR